MEQCLEDKLNIFSSSNFKNFKKSIIDKDRDAMTDGPKIVLKLD